MPYKIKNIYLNWSNLGKKGAEVRPESIVHKLAQLFYILIDMRLRNEQLLYIKEFDVEEETKIK